MNTKTKSSKRVIVLINSLSRGGGAELSLLILARTLKERGNLARLVTLSGGDLTYNLPSELVTYHSDLNSHNYFKAILQVASIAKAYSADIIFSALPQANLVAALAALLSRTRAAISIRTVISKEYVQLDTTSLMKRSLIALSAWLSWRIICISRAVADDFTAIFPLTSSKSRVLWNPILPPRDLHETEMKHSSRLILHNTAAPVRLISVGRLISSKGYEDLISAIVGLNRYKPVSLDIYGEGPERYRLEALVDRLSGMGIICFKGFDHFVNNKYKNYDAFILNSNIEGFGRVFFESLLCGTPIVFPSHLKSVLEIINGTPCYATYSECTSEQLLAALEYISGLNVSDVEGARNALLDRLSPESHTNAFLALIEEE